MSSSNIKNNFLIQFCIKGKVKIVFLNILFNKILSQSQTWYLYQNYIWVSKN